MLWCTGIALVAILFHLLDGSHLAISSPTDVADAASDSRLRYEEYVIEHEISATQAKNSVLHMTLDTSIEVPTGCQKCTANEKNYCLSSNFIADHCCCDRKHHEVLPYVPHTCYLGPNLCSTIIGDCNAYERLRRCCCEKYVFEKWKEKSSGTSTIAPLGLLLALTANLVIFVQIA
ncbi:PREDICTED: uncharacterized protein LOC108556806 [Nicrophorus vespilloides]|uniref:Uncharacterized protein LOC108556806 n=1 Tax=Nicrophorus vespilloides TaxID=110193 RepID=A0ABM1M1W7_NICVS|nr:PREDICTED: uncharacterized protein LOC108556806 [Nicrophorus vespilloides]